MILKQKKTGKKIIVRFSLIIILFIGIVIAFISPIAKYLVEKYDAKYLGREITTDWIYLNPFTGSIYISNLKVYELADNKIFFSANGVSANFSMLKLFSKTVQINSLEVDHPRGVIIQNKKHLNFSDIIERFSSRSTDKTKKDPILVSVLNVTINNGEFYYEEPSTPVKFSIKKVHLNSEGKYWDADTINGKLSFISGIGKGSLVSDFTINLKSLDYRLALIVHKFDMNIIEQYMRDFASYGNLTANIDATIKAKGSLKDQERLNMRGKIAVNDFHFGKNENEDYASFDKITIGITELDPKNKKYFFDSVQLIHPYFKYERYDRLDNIQRIFGKGGARVAAVNANPEKFNLIIEIAKYVKIIFKNFLKSDYKINNLDLKNGDFRYNDYSISEKFAVGLSPFTIKANSVNSENKWVKIFMESGIKPFGKISATVKINPKNNKDFNLNYKLQKIPAALFNPYLITYTSFPLERGEVELSGKWTVRDDHIQSTNHFILIDPRIAKRVRKKDTRWIPIPLIMSFVRERGNVIDYDIPITGDLKNPDFHIADVLKDLVKNIFIKPPTMYYGIEIRNTENEIEKSLSFKWGMRQTALNKTQTTFVKKISDFLKDNETASIAIHSYSYSEKEKESILFFEAKKKYFFKIHAKFKNMMTEEDSLSIEKMSSKDTSFVKYLDKHTNDSMLFTIQEKCYRFVGAAIVDKKMLLLIKEREQAFVEYFKINETEKRITFFENQNTIPFNGFSYFKIDYKGEVPETLMNAYHDLDEINSEPPRDKYLKFRKNKNK